MITGPSRFVQSRPSVLQNQSRPLTQNRPGRRIVLIVLALVAILNVGFTAFKNPVAPSRPSALRIAEVPDSEIALPPGMEDILQGEPDGKTALSTSTPPLPLKKASFAPLGTMDRERFGVLHINIRRSLVHSVCKKVRGDDCQLLSAYVARILSWYLDVSRSIRPGDTLDIVYQKLDSEERFRMVKVDFESQYLREKLSINYYRSPAMRHGSYFDNAGKEVPYRLSSDNSPVRDYVEITSLPGDYRNGHLHGHAGTDFKTEVGTPIFASFEGLVTRVNWNTRKNGYCVEIDHPRERVRTLYLHLNKVLVRPGQFVEQGRQIAESGNTGRSFAPHLHYEIKSRGPKKTVYNPFTFKYHKKYQRQVTREHMEEYTRLVQAYNSLLQSR